MRHRVARRHRRFGSERVEQGARGRLPPLQERAAILQPSCQQTEQRRAGPPSKCLVVDMRHAARGGIGPVRMGHAQPLRHANDRAVQARRGRHVEQAEEQCATQVFGGGLHRTTTQQPPHPAVRGRVPHPRQSAAEGGGRLQRAEGEERNVRGLVAAPTVANVGLGAVFNHHQSTRSCHGEGGGEVHPGPEQVRHHHGAGARADARGQSVRVPSGGEGVDVQRHRTEAVPAGDGRHVGNGQGGEDDLVAAPPIGAGHAQKQIEGGTRGEKRQRIAAIRPPSLQLFASLRPRRRGEAGAQGEAPVRPREVESSGGMHRPARRSPEFRQAAGYRGRERLIQRSPGERGSCRGRRPPRRENRPPADLRVGPCRSSATKTFVDPTASSAAKGCTFRRGPVD